MKNLYFLITAILVLSEVKAFTENDLPAYQNKIVKITEITGQSKNSIRIVFENLHPIIAYAPKNFAESNNRSFHRYILPHTVTDQSFNNDKISIEQDLNDVQVLVEGKLLMQSTGDDSIVFVIG